MQAESRFVLLGVGFSIAAGTVLSTTVINLLSFTASLAAGDMTAAGLRQIPATYLSTMTVCGVLALVIGPVFGSLGALLMLFQRRQMRSRLVATGWGFSIGSLLPALAVLAISLYNILRFGSAPTPDAAFPFAVFWTTGALTGAAFAWWQYPRIASFVPAPMGGSTYPQLEPSHGAGVTPAGNVAAPAAS